MVIESGARLFKCFRTPAPGVILSFTSTAKGRLKATLNAPIAEPHRFILEPFEARRFANLCGQFDEHLRLIEQRLSIEIRNRGNQFELIGDPQHTTSAENLCAVSTVRRRAASCHRKPCTCTCRSRQWKTWPTTL